MMSYDDKLDKLLSLVESLVDHRVLNAEWNEKHEEEHRYLREKIESEQYKKQFWLGVSRNIATAGIWTTITAVGTACIFSLTHFFKN